MCTSFKFILMIKNYLNLFVFGSWFFMVFNFWFEKITSRKNLFIMDGINVFELYADVTMWLMLSINIVYIIDVCFCHPRNNFNIYSTIKIALLWVKKMYCEPCQYPRTFQHYKILSLFWWVTAITIRKTNLILKSPGIQ